MTPLVQKSATEPDEGPFLRALATFPWACVTVTCALPRDFDEQPDLPDRIRGAIGARLREQPLYSDGALLHSIMFDDVAGEEISRPFTIQCDRRGNGLTVRVHLAGQAANLMVVAAFALRAALAGGIRMGPEMRRRVALVPSEPEFTRQTGFAIQKTSQPNRVHLRAVTPIALRRGQHGISGSIDTLPLNIEQRFRRLCRDWHTQSPGPSGIPSKFSACLILLEDGLAPDIYDHWSVARSTPSRIACVWGEAEALGDCTVFLPLLAFARIFHTGSSTALGLGRIEYAAS